MHILLIGDIVGSPGLKIVTTALPALRKRQSLDLVIANAENAAEGSGLSPAQYRKLIAAGVDCVTLGDHIYRRSEICGVLASETNILKPANFPSAAPGKTWALVAAAEEAGEGLDGLLGHAGDDRIKELEERLSHIEATLRAPTGDQPDTGDWLKDLEDQSSAHRQALDPGVAPERRRSTGSD